MSEQLPELLVDFPDISLVYLFGSQSRGQVGPMSDVDLAIVEQPRHDETQARFSSAVAKLLRTDRVDVVLLSRAPVDLAYQIIAHGELLYQKDVYTRVEIEARILGKYGDYLPILRYFNQQILEGEGHAIREQRYREALGRTLRTLGASSSSPPTTSP